MSHGFRRKARAVLACLLLFLAAFGPAAPAAAQMGGSHAAIAFSRSIFIANEGAARGWGISWGRMSGQEARAAAIRDCTNNDTAITDCRVVLAFNRGCGALAAGTRGVTTGIGTGQGRNVRAAQGAAIAQCRREASGCRVVATTCARSRTAP